MKGTTMANRLVHTLEGYVHAIFKDVESMYGSKRDYERDLNRSLHELAIRGERFLSLDLPAVRKHLEKCLEEGLYMPKGHYLSSMVSKQTKVPAFLRNFWLKIFDANGKLRSTPETVYAIADLRQLLDGMGKTKNICKQEAIDEEVENFLTIEAELRKPTLRWAEDVLYEDNRTHLDFSDAHDNLYQGRTEQGVLPGLDQSFERPKTGDIATLQRVCDVVSAQFGDLHLEQLDEFVFERPKHGSGRVSNQPRTESKFDFRDWPRKLDLVFHYDRYATPDLGYESYCDDSDRGYLRNHEHPSKLIAVPKTMKGPRLICSEPNYHQWIQQLIRSQIENRVKSTALKHCISFGDQRPNRDLALKGSRDGSIATVDLSSASDRLSCWTVERAFRSNKTMLERIHASRTRWMRNAINERFTSIMLKKCFTQGSACTFPVQTVVYSMFAIAAVLITEGGRVTTTSVDKAARKVRVFGDDIIVPKTVLPKLVEILSFNQLKVNLDKTFLKGKFRESCGMDAYDGVDVTPARVRRLSANPSHETVDAILAASNNYYKKGLWHTAYWLRDLIRGHKFPVIKARDSEYVDEGILRAKGLKSSGGIECYLGNDYSHLKSRWNKHLHTQEYKMDFLTSKSKKIPTQSAYDLMEFTSLSNPIDPSRKNLAHLTPLERGLGIVNKQSSVMKTGWKTLA
jgi:hypothetical protein